MYELGVNDLEGQDGGWNRAALRSPRLPHTAQGDECLVGPLAPTVMNLWGFWVKEDALRRPR